MMTLATDCNTLQHAAIKLTALGDDVIFKGFEDVYICNYVCVYIYVCVCVYMYMYI